MQALPKRYFDLVRAEEVCLGRRTFGARFMGPEVTKADLEDFVRARLGQNAQCLRKVMSFSNSFDIYSSEEEERDNVERLDGQRLKGHKRPMRVAPIPFALPVTEVFDFVGKRLVQEERDRLWSRAIRPDVHAPTPQVLKPGFGPQSVHKKVREVDLDPKSRSYSEGASKTKRRGTGPKKPAKEEGSAGPTVARVATGKPQPPVLPKAPANLAEMVIPSPNWPKHGAPTGPEFRGCTFCLRRDLLHDHDHNSSVIRAESDRRRLASPYANESRGKGKGGAGGKGKGASH